MKGLEYFSSRGDQCVLHFLYRFTMYLVRRVRSENVTFSPDYCYQFLTTDIYLQLHSPDLITSTLKSCPSSSETVL
jgi:hypothetical protein